MNLEIITEPLIGAAIGLVTNGIAIKMLFRPWKAIYIGKFHIPFTPGLIPKEKPRIAKAIANVIGNNLLDNETIQKTLLSDEIKNKIMSAIDNKISALSSEEVTLSEFITQRGFMETVDEKEKVINSSVSAFVTDKLISSNVSASMVDFASEELTKNANPVVAGIASKAISSARDSIISKIDSMIKEKAPDILSELIDKEYEKLKDKQIKECLTVILDKFPDYHEYIWKIYISLIDKQLNKVLDGFNIKGIVEQKINDFELPELEKLIMSIMQKELYALVALGGILGFLMGLFNLII
ncbi:MAG: DUF445 family protein [Oscillospiraceae bacterium]|nr:DUF445 family protein [Oscillospiraceae bacterium]